MRTVWLIVGLCMVLSGAAYADILLTVDNSISTTHFNQQQSSPCIYGYPSCSASPAGFPAFSSIQVGGNVGTVDAGTVANNPSNSQPVLFNVAASKMTALGGNAIWVGVDVNENDDPSINILQFDIVDTTTSTTLAHLNANTVLSAFANGTGFSDAILTGLDLTGVTGTDNIQFRLRYNGASDGSEQFFLIAQANPPSAIPEPASVVLLGTLCLGLAHLYRRRRSV